MSASDLVIENESLNTYQNARNVASIVQPEPDESLILITSVHHMERSLLAFNAFGLDTQAFTSNVRQPQATFFTGSCGFIDTETALHELVGLARFRVYRRLGLY